MSLLFMVVVFEESLLGQSFAADLAPAAGGSTEVDYTLCLVEYVVDVIDL